MTIANPTRISVTVLSTLVALLTVPGTAARAAIFNVTSTDDRPASAAALTQGICDDGGGQCTLRAAIQAADALSESSTVNLPAGTYTLSIAGTDEGSTDTNGTYEAVHTPDPSKGDLNITQSLTLVGAGAAQTVIGWPDGAQQDRVFHVEVPSTAAANITVSIQGVTIQNGYVPDPVTLDDTNPNAVVRFVRSGGGIAVGTAAAVVTVNPNATHGSGGAGGESGGSAGHGGPGQSESGASIDLVSLSDVHIVNNHSGGDGGGLYNLAPLAAERLVATGNSSVANGGGLYNDAAMTLTDSTVGTPAAPNTAENGGGMFETGFHTSLISKTAITGNSAVGGGGIAGRRLVLEEITNSTIADNTARDTGGGITTNGRVTLTNATVAGNTISTTTEGGGAGLNGFGPASGGSAGGGATASNYTLVNTILAGNTLDGTTPTLANCGGTGEGNPSARFFSLGHNLEDADTCGFSAAGDLTGVDPLLQPLADNGGPTQTMALVQSSPGVDAGDDSACPNNDQRGDLRPADGNLDGTFQCDIGAFELFIPSADLHMHNMNAPDSVFTGEQFSVTAQAHISPQATSASTGVQLVTDPLPSGLTLVSATVTTPSLTRSCALSARVVTCDAGTLNPDETATMSLALTAASPAPSLTITATASQQTPNDPNPNNNAAHVHVAVFGESNLGVSASGPTSPVEIGTHTDINFTVNNAGPDDATGVRVGVELSNEVSFRAISLPGATCSSDTSSTPATVLCTLDSLPADTSLSGTLTLTGAAEGQAVTTIAVDAQQRDPDLNDNQTNTVASIKARGTKTGGCSLNPGGGFDPTLIAVIVVSLIRLKAHEREKTYPR